MYVSVEGHGLGSEGGDFYKATLYLEMMVMYITALKMAWVYQRCNTILLCAAENKKGKLMCFLSKFG